MSTEASSTLPTLVRLAGSWEHSDFREAVELLRRDSNVEHFDNSQPELIVVAQARPGEVSAREVLQLQRQFPLAGMVALLGSWCEGETRTGRPWPGVRRLYWYEFSAWWSRQLERGAEGRCPDWARAVDFGLAIADCGLKADCANGLIVVRTAVRESADAISDVLSRAGYATIWQPRSRTLSLVRGAVAAIWDGGQLSVAEEKELVAYRRRIGESVPVVAVLDFPRRDRVEQARSLGAAAVMGKPWSNTDLLATVKAAIRNGSEEICRMVA